MVIDTKVLNGKPLIEIEEFLSKISRVSKETAQSHYTENIEAWKEYKNSKSFKYIENQHELNALKYGCDKKLYRKWFNNNRDLRASNNCCEVAALFNSILSVSGPDDRFDFPNLLEYFETNGTILKGYFGTSIKAIVRFLKKNGFDCDSVTGRNITKERLDDIQKDYDAYLFMSYNNTKNIPDMIHTVSVTREEGSYVSHNSFDPVVKYESLYDAVLKYNSYRDCISRPITVVGFKKNEGENSEKD